MAKAKGMLGWGGILTLLEEGWEEVNSHFTGHWGTEDAWRCLQELEKKLDSLEPLPFPM